MGSKRPRGKGGAEEDRCPVHPRLPALLPQHRSDLRKSGLSPAVIAEAGIYSESDPRKVGGLLGWDGPAKALGPCLVFPFLGPDGAPSGYARVKPDTPRVGDDGKTIKYESPRGRSNEADFAPGFRGRWAQLSAPVVISEGEKKALAAAEAGFTSIGLVGVWGWQKKRPKGGAGRGVGPRELIDGLAALDWRGRQAVILFDSDAAVKPSVASAERALAEALARQGADVRVGRLPPGPVSGDGSPAKVGLDDFQVAHGPDALRRLIAEAQRVGAKRPILRPVPPFRDFPTHLLPSPLNLFVERTAAALSCDPSYVALPALAAVFACVGNARRIRLKRGWTEPAVAWFAVVGESGTLKSPGQDAALAPLERVEAKLAAERQELFRLYGIEKDVYQEARRKALKEGKEPSAEPERPPERRAVVSDITIERLAELLDDNPRGLLLSREELAGWLGSFSRYRAKAALECSDLPHWLSMHGARPLRVDRKSGERRTIYVPRAAVTVVGGIQPGTLARCLAPAYFESGLVARLLLAMPPRRPKAWTEAEVPTEVVEGYAQLLERLLALDFDKREEGESCPFVLRLSPEAKKRWVEFYDAWAAEQEAAEGEFAALLSKLEGYCGRLALVHHVVVRVARGEDDREPVSADSVEAAAGLTRWFADEAQRIYLVLADSEEQRQVRALVEALRRRGGRITPRELMFANRRRYPDAEVAAAALQGLVEGGLAEWVDAPAGPRGGRPTRACALCVTYHETHETPCDEGDQAEPGDRAACHTTADAGPSGAENPRIFKGSGGSVSCVIRDTDSGAAGESSNGAHPGPGGCVTQPRAPDSGLDSPPDYPVREREEEVIL